MEEQKEPRKKGPPYSTAGQYREDNNIGGSASDKGSNRFADGVMFFFFMMMSIVCAGILVWEYDFAALVLAIFIAMFAWATVAAAMGKLN